MAKRNPVWHKLTGAIPFPERMKDLQSVIDQQGVAFIKTHDYPSNVSPECGVIYLLRDGREACVSYWHYLREIGKMEITLREVIEGKYPFGGWSQHVRAWWSKPRLNTWFIRYEDALWERASVIVTLEHILGRSAARFNTAAWQDFHQSDPQFFRSGTNDTWKTEMVGDDLALFDELHGDTMQEYGYYPAKEPVYV